MSDNIKTRRQIDEIENANAPDEHKSKKFKEDPEEDKDDDKQDSGSQTTTQTTQTLPGGTKEESRELKAEVTDQEYESNDEMDEVLDFSQCLSDTNDTKMKIPDHFLTTPNSTMSGSTCIPKTEPKHINELKGASEPFKVESNSSNNSALKRSNTLELFDTDQSSCTQSYELPSTSSEHSTSTQRKIQKISPGCGLSSNEIHNPPLPSTSTLPGPSLSWNMQSNDVEENTVSSGSLGRGGAVSHPQQGNQGQSNNSIGGTPILPMNYDVPVLPVNQGMPVIPGLPFLPVNNNVPYIPLISGMPFLPICHGVPVVPAFHTIPVAQVSRGVQVPPLGGGFGALDEIPNIPVQPSASHTLSSSSTAGNTDQPVCENQEQGASTEDVGTFKVPLCFEKQQDALEQEFSADNSHDEYQNSKGNKESPEMENSASGGIPAAKDFKVGTSDPSSLQSIGNSGFPVCHGLNFNQGLSPLQNYSLPDSSVYRGLSLGSSGRGSQAPPPDRGFQSFPVGRGLATVPLGPGFQASSLGRGFQAFPIGRGFQALSLGRGFQAGPVAGPSSAEGAPTAPVLNSIQAGPSAPAGAGPSATLPAGQGIQAGPSAALPAGRGIQAGPSAPPAQGMQAGPIVGRGIAAPLAGRGLPILQAGRGLLGGPGGRGFPLAPVGRGFHPAIFGRGFPVLPLGRGFHGGPAGRGLIPAAMGQVGPVGRGHQTGQGGRGVPVSPMSHRAFVPVGHGFPAAEGNVEPDPPGVADAPSPPPAAFLVEPAVADPLQNDAPVIGHPPLPDNEILDADPANPIEENIVPIPGPMRHPIYFQIRVQEPITPGRTIPAVAIPVQGPPPNAHNARNEPRDDNEVVPFGPVYSIPRPFGSGNGNDELILVPSANIFPQNNFFIQMIQNLMKRESYPDLNAMLNATMERDYMEFVNRVMEAKARNNPQDIHDGVLLYLSCPGSLDAKKQIMRYCVGVVLPDYEIDEDIGEHTAIVEALVDSGANVNVTSLGGETPLHKLARSGPLSSAQVLIDAGGDHYRRDKKGRTPLYIAASFGRNNFVEEFIDVGSELSAAAKDRSTPLHVASLGGHAETVRLLLIAGADRNAQDQHGVTPLAASTNMMVNMVFARRQEDLKYPISSEELRHFMDDAPANDP